MKNCSENIIYINKSLQNLTTITTEAKPSPQGGYGGIIPSNTNPKETNE